MGKKSFGQGLDSLLGATIQEEERKDPIKAEEKKLRGRPITNTREITKTSQKGTKEGETRSTFIVNEKALERLKALSYWKRKKIKSVLHEALETYFKGHSFEEIKRAEEAYQLREDSWEIS